MTITLYELVGSDASRPFSPHCWKARMALAHKGLGFETVPTAFTAIPRIEGGATAILPLIRDGETLVADSFQIAEYLEATYPDRPTLFGGEGGRATARFVEAFSQKTLHPFLGFCAMKEIHDMLDAPDRAYFRQSREERFGRTLESFAADRVEGLAAFRARLDVLRVVLGRQPFIGGEGPLFADHILFSAFQWARVTTPYEVLEPADPVAAWFERCLDLYGGEGRKVRAA